MDKNTKPSEEEPKKVKKPKQKKEESLAERKVYGKFYIDLKHYKNNILSLKYCKTENVVPSFKSIIMSAQVKAVVKEMLDLSYIDKTKYEKLTAEDKRLIDRLSGYMKINHDIKKESDDDVQKQFQILVGEATAGNDSPLIKAQLKKYILQAVNENRMSRMQAYQLMMELNL
jgi:hypothetical protein